MNYITELVNTIKLTGIVDEDIVNYKKCSMFLSTSTCNWKCCKEAGIPISVCQNNPLIGTHKIIKISDIIDRYQKNDLSEALVIGGLEPFDQFEEVYSLMVRFREVSNDEIIIYTGYTETELMENGLIWYIESMPGTTIVKYGRYVPNSSSVPDIHLGVQLASNNQYSIRYDRSDMDTFDGKYFWGETNIYVPSNGYNRYKTKKVHCWMFKDELTGEDSINGIELLYLDNIKAKEMGYIPKDSIVLDRIDLISAIKEHVYEN